MRPSSAAIEDALADPAALHALGSGRGWVIDGLLGAEVSAEVRATALRLDADGGLRPAGIGAGGRQVRTIRGDRIAWLDPDSAPAGLQPVLALFSTLMVGLRETVWLGTDAMDCQLAIYDAGASYAMHRDSLHGSTSRRATAVYYANDWQPSDGGELDWVDPSDGTTTSVAPIADRLVVFRAETTDHAVRTVLRGPRISLSAFFRASSGDVLPRRR